MRRVADQRDARVQHAARQLAPQREGKSRRVQHAVAQAAIERARQFLAEGRIVDGQQPLRVGLGQGPDDGTAPANAGQEGERAVGKEALPAGILVRPRRADVGNQPALCVIALIRSDARQRGHARGGAIGAQQQSRAQELPIIQPQRRGLVVLHEGFRAGRADPPDPGLLRKRCPQPVHQQPVLDDMAQPGTTEPVGVEIQRACADRIPDMHRAIRKHAFPCDRVPGAQTVEEGAGVGRDRINAQVRRGGVPCRWNGRLDDRHAQAGARQRERSAGAHHARPDDHHVEQARAASARGFAHRRAHGVRARRGTRPRKPIAPEASGADSPGT